MLYYVKTQSDIELMKLAIKEWWWLQLIIDCEMIMLKLIPQLLKGW